MKTLAFILIVLSFIALGCDGRGYHVSPNHGGYYHHSPTPMYHHR